MSFTELGLTEPILRAVLEEGYTQPTEVQTQAIPAILEGRDLLGCAQTGTGKTAAFALPVLDMLSRRPAPARTTGPEAPVEESQAQPAPGSGRRGRRRRRSADRGVTPIRVLVLTPTRELAHQVAESFDAYGRHVAVTSVMVYGGVKKLPQIRKLREGSDVVIATPGRLLDLMGEGDVDLSNLEVLILDEADRMLDMGFMPDIRRIIATIPRQRQTLLFSATIPAYIRRLSESLLNEPVEVTVNPKAPAAETVDHAVYFVERLDKDKLLRHVLGSEDVTRALVFTGTKRQADALLRDLKRNEIAASVIHSDRTQQERQQALSQFKDGSCRVLIASDVAARGLDVDDISHVINYDMPQDAETYVHRIGRTGRAGCKGKAISFCSIDERGMLVQIERFMHTTLVEVEDHPCASPIPARLTSTTPASGHARAGASGASPWRRLTKRRPATRRRR